LPVTKSDFLQQQIERLFRVWLYRALLAGCVLFLGLATLDYVVTPENFGLFFCFRLAICGLLLLIAYLSNKVKSKTTLDVLAYIGLMASGVTIELMILRWGGHASPYYVGLILLALCAASFIPTSKRFNLLLCSSLYLLYLLPILLFDIITNGRYFFMANVFLLASLGTLIFVHYLFSQHLNNELELQFELMQQQGCLEELVKERTLQLSQAVEQLKWQIEERKKSEAEKAELQVRFLHSQKMESLGHLAGGVAHDFNNMLTVIVGCSELMLHQLPKDHSERDTLKMIHEAGKRGTNLTRQLLAFSRKQVLAMEVICLDVIIEQISTMLTRLIGEDIKLELKLEAEDSQILADRGQIEQILLNLAVNARDAMPQGGRLLIQTSRVPLSELPLAIRESSRDWIAFKISDTGVGISKEISEKIFDPFFTTKERGKGTGLGLATVYGIVKQHEGHIQMQSTLGQGTTFTIFLPRNKEEARSPSEAVGVSVLTGSERFLVLDDDVLVRKFVVAVLEKAGYKVLQAGSGDEALALASPSSDTIDLFLTDVVMPGMNGQAVARAIQTRQPQIKVLYMSGYVDDALAEQGVLEKGLSFIAKPLDPHKLYLKVRQVLDG
jgi:signal transduction histidine kinase/CheY-like chemotaxis protein